MDFEVENTGQESAVNQPEATQEPIDQSAAESQSEASSEASGGSDKLPPFHEHPRFKEVIEQNRSYKESLSSYEQKLRQMEAQMQQVIEQRKQNQPEKPGYDQILARLQQIDPEFGQFQGELLQKVSSLDKIEQQLQQFQQWQQRVEHQSTASQLDSLYGQHKVPENLRSLYKAQLVDISNSNPNLTPADLPRVFKEVHENLNKIFDTVKRQERESYVADKKKDVTPAVTTGGKAPMTPKGGPESLQDVKNSVAKMLREGRKKV